MWFEVVYLLNLLVIMVCFDLMFDLVWLGIVVYGLSLVFVFGDMGLVLVMIVKCVVVLVKLICVGEGVLYGYIWIVLCDINLVLLLIGYVDGVFWLLGGWLEVLINGR